MPTKRYQHSWRPAAADQYPTQYICVDCEAATEQVSARPPVERERLTRWYASSRRLSGGRVVRTGTAEGSTSAEWWQSLEPWLASGTCTWIFVGNSGRVLTLLNFWQRIEQEYLAIVGGNKRDRGSDDDGTSKGTFGCVIIEDPPTILLLSRGKGRGQVKAVDLRNYGPDLPTWQGGAKERAAAQADWVSRAVGILRDNTLGSWRCTAGAQAVYSLRRRLMPTPLYTHNFSSFLRLERDAYHGGRCEAYHVGELEGELFHLDIRNLYPWCGWHFDMPHLPEQYYEEPDPGQASEFALSKVCFGDVTVRTGRADYPLVAELSADNPPGAVPLHDGRFTGVSRGNTVYPCGTFRTCLAGPELRDAVIHGRVVAFHRLATYHGANLLAPFYATWYGLLERARKDGDRPTQQWIKRVMVSLVGKLAETGKTWVPANPDPSHGPYAAWMEIDKDGRKTRYRNVAWYTQREEVSAEGGESCPAIAAWVTSLGRVRLLHLMRSAGRENVYYCDTDSLITNRAGYEQLLVLGQVREAEIGYLRLVGVHQRACVYGIKHYSLDGVYKCAGLPRGTVTESTEPGYGWYRRTVADSVSAGAEPQVLDTLVAFARKRGYRHGVVLDDGSVVPWQIGESCDD